MNHSPHHLNKLDRSSYYNFTAFFILNELLNHENKGLKLPAFNPFTFHRLFLGIAICAVKFCSDFFPTNKDFARKAGVTLEELNRIEKDVMKRLDWRLYPISTPQDAVKELCRKEAPSLREVLFDDPELNNGTDLEDRFLKFFSRNIFFSAPLELHKETPPGPPSSPILNPL